MKHLWAFSLVSLFAANAWSQEPQTDDDKKGGGKIKIRNDEKKETTDRKLTGPTSAIKIQADRTFFFSLNDGPVRKVTKGKPENVNLNAAVHKLEFEEADSTGERIERYFRMTKEMVNQKFDTTYTITFQKDFAQLTGQQKADPPPTPIKPPQKQFDQKVETIAIELRQDMQLFQNDAQGTNGNAASSFYIGKHEVTQRQWQQVMEANKSEKKNCANCPVENISWNDAVAFIEKLNQNSDTKFRLPTAAEWEVVANKIEKQEIHAIPTEYLDQWKTFVERTSFHNKSKNSGPQEVGKKEAAGGLYDLLGNVAEWCADDDQSGRKKIIKGGSLLDKTNDLRPKHPDAENPSASRKSLGFRLVANAN